MNLPMTIRVTAGHIVRGQHRSANFCPVALAIRERWPGRQPGGVEVGGYLPGFARVHDEGWWRAALPTVARDFVQDFDERSPVAPFEFTVKWTAENGEPS